MLRRFRVFLDGIGPLLKNRVRYLSIGNESDIYLSLNPQDFAPFQKFLEAARLHAKKDFSNAHGWDDVEWAWCAEKTVSRIGSRIRRAFCGRITTNTRASMGSLRRRQTPKKKCSILFQNLVIVQLYFKRLDIPPIPKSARPKNKPSLSRVFSTHGIRSVPAFLFSTTS